MDNEEGWRVGELARATGLTVRTLHYYDEIGLLKPSHRTGSGHRWYSAGDVQRRIPGLVYDDIEAAHTFLVEVFGLEAGRLDRDGDGKVHHAEVTAGDGVIWLHRVAREFGLDSPKNLGMDTAGMSVMNARLAPVVRRTGL